MKAHNILFLAAIKDIIGGGEISLLEFLNKLDRSRFSPLVVCPDKGSLKDAVERMQIATEIIRIGDISNPFNIFSTIKTLEGLKAFIREREIELIHSNACGRPTLLWGIAARLKGIPLIWHVRTIGSGGLADIAQACLARKIIVISESVRKRFKWLKAENKIIRVYNGVDSVKYNNDINTDNIKKELGLKEDFLVVGIVSRLDPWKGHKYFLQAAAKIVKKIEKIRFLIVGGVIDKYKKYADELKSLPSKLGITKYVIFTGFRTDLAEVFNSLDLLVLCSINEPFGRVLIEAMACAKPVIATDAAGPREIVEDKKTGILVPMRDPDSLAEAMLNLLENRKEANQMGEEARKRAREFFSIEAHVKNIEYIYEGLLGKGKLTNENRH